MAEIIQGCLFLTGKVQEGELLPGEHLSSACGLTVCEAVNGGAARPPRGVCGNPDEVVRHVSRIFANWQANLSLQV